MAWQRDARGGREGSRTAHGTRVRCAQEGRDWRSAVSEEGLCRVCRIETVGRPSLRVLRTSLALAYKVASLVSTASTAALSREQQHQHRLSSDWLRGPEP